MTKEDERYLTDAEYDIYKGIKSARAKQVEEMLIKKAVATALGIERDKYLPSGEKIVVTVAEELAAKTIKEALNNPSTSKLKDLSAIMGENKTVVEVQTDKGMDMFLGITKGAKVDEIVEEREKEKVNDTDS